MIALVDIATGAILGYTPSTEGIDLTGIEAVEAPDHFDPVQPSHVLVDGAWIENLAFLKRRMTDEVNARAEQARCLYLTPGSGQAITYARKEAEARAWTEDADPADFPFLAAEARGTGSPIADVAALVVAQADAWVAVGAAIEGNRRGLVVAIEAAADPSELTAIDAESGWPEP